MPIFSVIIPCFNRIQFLEEAIDSVLNQVIASFEIIIVDDGSEELVSQKISVLTDVDERIRFFRKNENTGVSSARNLALQHVKGDYVCFLDDDDTIAPSFFQYALDVFHQQPGIDITLCQPAVHPKSAKSRLPYHVLKETLASQPDDLTYDQYHPGRLYQYPPQINSMVFRSVLFDRFTFKESLEVGEDIYLWFELLNAGLTFGRKQSKEPLAFIRVHEADQLSQPAHQEIIVFQQRLQMDFGQMDQSLQVIIDFKLFMRHMILGQFKLGLIALIKSMKSPIECLKIAGSQLLLKTKALISYFLFKGFSMDR